MARITSEAAVAAVGSRYDLVLIASQRARELMQGATPKIQSKNSSLITAIREVELGLYTKNDYLKTIRKHK